MDREEGQRVSGGEALPPPKRRCGITRRQVLKYGLAAAAGLSGAGSLMWYLLRGRAIGGAITAEIFKNDAPPEDLWRLWQNGQAYDEVKYLAQLEHRHSLTSTKLQLAL